MQQVPVDDSRYFAAGVRIASGLDEVEKTITPFGQKVMFIDANLPRMYLREVDAYGVVAPIKIWECKEITNGTEGVGNGAGSYVTVDQFNDAMKSLEDKYESILSAIGANATATNEPDVATAAAQQYAAAEPDVTPAVVYQQQATAEPVYTAASNGAIRGRYAQPRSAVDTAASAAANTAAGGTVLQ